MTSRAKRKRAPLEVTLSPEAHRKLRSEAQLGAVRVGREAITDSPWASKSAIVEWLILTYL